MKQLINDLLAHNHEVTGIPIPHKFPRIAFGSDSYIRKTLGNPAEYKDSVIIAVYTENEKRILLNNKWREFNVEDQSVLAHELVHHMQNEAGILDETCEAAAYTAQFAYLRKRGLDPFALGWTEEYMK